MKSTLIIDGKEFEIDIDAKELDRLKNKLKENVKKTGYDRVLENETYHYDSGKEEVISCPEIDCALDEVLYDGANYYSDKTIAENNARADKLMRRLRRFAAEHNKYKLDWNNSTQCKFWIVYDYSKKHKLKTAYKGVTRYPNLVYFDSDITAKAAIEEFYDELIWYFTEYKDSL